MKVLAVLFLIGSVGLAVPGLAAEQRIADIYKRSCIACHAGGARNIPKTGAVEQWQALIDKKGMDALVQSVQSGLNAMPPKGLCFDCSDQDYRSVIEYMMVPQS